MKATFTVGGMLLLGAIGGFLLAPVVFEWLASAAQASLVATTLAGTFISRLQFSFGCGALFAAAAIAPIWGMRGLRPARWILLYLLLGCVVSGSTAALYHARYSSTADALQLAGILRVVSVDTLPALRVPLSGAFAVLCLAILHRSLSRLHDRSADMSRPRQAANQDSG